MNPKIITKDEYIVCGMETKLTQSQTQNIAIATTFWKDFNAQLRQANIFQKNNWRKYAFTYAKNNEHYYFCAIPDRPDIPDAFKRIHIRKHQFLIFEHHGVMQNLKLTLNYIYKVYLPASNFMPDSSQFNHYEKYTEKFQWNKESSIIYIYVPVTKRKV